MRKEKQFLLDDLTSGITRSDSFFILRHKLTANQSTFFRGELLKRGGEMEVASKRMVLKTADSRGFKFDRGQLKGHVAFVYIKAEPVEIAKYAINFGKESDQAVELLGGVLEGKGFTAADVAAIEGLPNKLESRAQLLATLEAPVSELLAVLEAICGSVVYCLHGQEEAMQKMESAS